MTERMTEPPTTNTDFWYVDVSAVRIQTWLGRTGAVRLRRGASYRLTSLSSKPEVEALLASQGAGAGVEWNDEAGEVSGVICLRFPAAGLTEGEARAQASRLAITCARHIRAAFPALSLVGHFGRASTYVEAYSGDMRLRTARGDVALDLPALVDEGTVGKPCDTCRVSRAVHPNETIVGEETVDLCRDCKSRAIGAGYLSAKDTAELPQSQRKLYERFEQEGMVRGFPEDFESLADHRPRDTRSGDAASHLATIFADGNRIGALIDAWLEAGGHSRDGSTVGKQQIVTLLNDATIAAVFQAARALDPVGTDDPSTTKPLVPMLVHLAGGDDILLTVPAPLGWQTALALAAAFEDEVCENGLGSIFGVPGPSLSMGMVFHHRSHPFADVLDKAEHLLKGAKRQTLGKEAAIAFLDLTADGESSAGVVELRCHTEVSPTQRVPLVVSQLLPRLGLLSEIAKVESSQRNNLLQLLRDCAQPSVHEAGVGPRATLAHRVERMSNRAILVATVGAGATLDRVTADLQSVDPTARNALRKHLDLARWWPTKPPTIPTRVKQLSSAGGPR